jgi:hypothetical protein
VKSTRPRARERQQGMGTRGAKRGDRGFEELAPEVRLAGPGRELYVVEFERVARP